MVIQLLLFCHHFACHSAYQYHRRHHIHHFSGRLFLSRYEEEKKYAKGFTNIFIPDGPLNGLDVCYYTKAMLTGAGTFAREAALLGTPSVSFFPGKTFLTVDTIMQDKGWEFKSRDPLAIKNYVDNAKPRPSQIKRSKIVLTSVIKQLEKIIEKETKQ